MNNCYIFFYAHKNVNKLWFHSGWGLTKLQVKVISLAKPEPWKWEFGVRGVSEALRGCSLQCVPYCSLISAGSLCGEGEAVMERGGRQTEQRKLLVHRCSVGVSVSFCPWLAEVNTEKWLTTDSGLVTSDVIDCHSTTNVRESGRTKASCRHANDKMLENYSRMPEKGHAVHIS